MSETLVQLIPAAVGLLVLGVVAALAFLAKFLHEKGAASKAARVGSVISEAARKAVLEVDVTLKPQLDSALKDGVLSEDEKKILKDAAVKMLKDKLPGGLLALAKSVYGALTEEYIAGAVEQAVKEKKVLEALTKHGEVKVDDSPKS